MLSANGGGLPVHVDFTSASFKKGGGGGGVKIGGGSSLNEHQIPGVVYAVVYGILMLCAIRALWKGATRSYIHWFALGTAFTGLLTSALDAASESSDGAGESTLVGSAVFSYLFQDVVLVTLVAACTDATRRSARHAGLLAKARKALLISIAGYVCAFLATIMLAPMFLLPAIVYDYYSYIDYEINPSWAAVRCLSLIFLLAGYITAIVIYAWGKKMGGMPRRLRWVIPVCLAAFGSSWLYHVVSAGITISLMRDVNLTYAWWTWYHLSNVLFLVMLIFFYKGSHTDNVTHTPSVLEAYKVETPTEHPPMMAGAAPLTNLDYGSPAAAPVAPQPQAMHQGPYPPQQTYSPPPQPFTPPPQQPYSPPPQQGFNTSPTHPVHDHAYGGNIPQTPPHVSAHGPYAAPMSMQSGHSQAPAPISGDTPIWIQPPGQQGYWATYSSIGQAPPPPPPHGHA